MNLPTKHFNFRLAVFVGMSLLAAQSVVAQEQRDLPFDVFGKAINNRQIYRHLETEAGKLVAAQPENAVDDFLNALKAAKSSCELTLGSLSNSTAVEKDELYEHMVKSTLFVGELYDCGRCDRTHAAYSSGVAISEDGLALTNYHVIQGSSHLLTEGFIAMTYDGRCFEIEEILAASKSADIALIRLKANGYKFYAAPIADRRPKPIEPIRIVSHPSGEFFVMTKGEVSRYSQTGNQVFLEVTADFGGGSSGSAAFNDKGEIVGLVSRIHPLIKNKKTVLGGKANASGQKTASKSFTEMVLRRCMPLEVIHSCFASEAGGTNQTQGTDLDLASNVEQEESPAQKNEVVGEQAETEPGEATADKASTNDRGQRHKLVPGSEVSLSPVIQAEWIKGEPPESFESGKVYIFECWSTKCGPCIGMIPHVNELHKKYYDKGLRIYGMSVYENDKVECEKFVKEKGDEMSYPVAFTGKGGPFEVEWMRPAGAKGIPHAFIVRNGKLLASTLASRLTNELVETMLDGDEGAEKAAATILAAQLHESKINQLLDNIRSARRNKDTETMTANIEKLKVIDPENAEIHTEELWVLMIDEQWPAAVTALNEMPASWAKDGFVSMTSMRLARRKPHNYSADFEKALIHSYSDYVFGKEQAGYVGPNHFACLSILQWGIGEKENAITTADKMIDAAKAFSNGREYYVKSYERFAKSVHESTMPEFSELSKWIREAKQEATAGN